MVRFFDAHCHRREGAAVLPDGFVPDPDGGRLLCGVDPGDWAAVGALAGEWKGTTPAFGLHPWHVGAARAGWDDELVRFLETYPGSWVGETGLDALKKGIVSEAAQEEAFVVQLRAAARLGRPVNLHCVRADERLLALLDREYLGGGTRAYLVHSFNGPHQAIGKHRDRGAFFSVGPLAARRDTPRIRARVALLPRDRIVLESDANLGPGVDARADLAYTLGWLAALFGESEAVTGEWVYANSQRMLADAR